MGAEGLVVDITIVAVYKFVSFDKSSGIISMEWRDAEWQGHVLVLDGLHNRNKALGSERFEDRIRSRDRG